MDKLTWIEENTVSAWLASGAIQLQTTGNENSYYLDQFGNQFYCKNYPGHYNVNGMLHKWQLWKNRNNDQTAVQKGCVETELAVHA